MTRGIVVECACGDVDEADRIATALIERRLAACVQIAPVTSVYRWQGAVERSDEHLLRIKTRTDRFDAVAQAIRALHSYDVAEVVALAMVDADPAYLAWLADATGEPAPARPEPQA